MKESERKRPYRPRAPHKEGCQCSGCKVKRGEGKKASAPPEVKTEQPKAVSQVQLGTLVTRALFELKGQRYRVGEVTGELSVCALLFFRNNGPDPADQYWAVLKTVSLGKATMVMPIK